MGALQVRVVVPPADNLDGYADLTVLDETAHGLAELMTFPDSVNADVTFSTYWPYAAAQALLEHAGMVADRWVPATRWRGLQARAVRLPAAPPNCPPTCHVGHRFTELSKCARIIDLDDPVAVVDHSCVIGCTTADPVKGWQVVVRRRDEYIAEGPMYGRPGVTVIRGKEAAPLGPVKTGLLVELLDLARAALRSWTVEHPTPRPRQGAGVMPPPRPPARAAGTEDDR